MRAEGNPCEADQRAWEEEFAAAARRPLEVRLRYAFVRTYKPVMDDAPYRSFETMADYRQCVKRTCRRGWLRPCLNGVRQTTARSIGAPRHAFHPLQIINAVMFKQECSTHSWIAQSVLKHSSRDVFGNFVTRGLLWTCRRPLAISRA